MCNCNTEILEDLFFLNGFSSITFTFDIENKRKILFLDVPAIGNCSNNLQIYSQKFIFQRTTQD